MFLKVKLKAKIKIEVNNYFILEYNYKKLLESC